MLYLNSFHKIGGFVGGAEGMAPQTFGGIWRR